MYLPGSGTFLSPTVLVPNLSQCCAAGPRKPYLYESFAAVLSLIRVSEFNHKNKIQVTVTFANIRQYLKREYNTFHVSSHIRSFLDVRKQMVILPDVL